MSCAHLLKSFSKKHIAPSRVCSDNAAENNTREEEKAVAAAEVAAPDNSTIDGAPDEELFLPCQAHKGDF